jgi:hypothetical protein
MPYCVYSFSNSAANDRAVLAVLFMLVGAVIESIS